MTSGRTRCHSQDGRCRDGRWGIALYNSLNYLYNYMSPGLHQQVDCLLLPVWSLKYSLITETLKKFQPHIDAQNFNLILTHKIVSIFSQTHWDLSFWETIGFPWVTRKIRTLFFILK